MSVVNRAIIRVVLSKVALNLNRSVATSSGVESDKILKEKQKRVTEVPLTIYGNVKPESVKRAQELLMEHLDENSNVDNVVVV